MEPSHPSKYDVRWYLDQLQQATDNLSNDLTALVELHSLTSWDVRRHSENAPPFDGFIEPPRIRTVVENYLRNGAGELFWPAHMWDPFFQQLQWPAEADQERY